VWEAAEAVAAMQAAKVVTTLTDKGQATSSGQGEEERDTLEGRTDPGTTSI